MPNKKKTPNSSYYYRAQLPILESLEKVDPNTLILETARPPQVYPLNARSSVCICRLLSYVESTVFS